MPFEFTTAVKKVDNDEGGGDPIDICDNSAVYGAGG